MKKIFLILGLLTNLQIYCMGIKKLNLKRINFNIILNQIVKRKQGFSDQSSLFRKDVKSGINTQVQKFRSGFKREYDIITRTPELKPYEIPSKKTLEEANAYSPLNMLIIYLQKFYSITSFYLDRSKESELAKKYKEIQNDLLGEYLITKFYLLSESGIYENKPNIIEEDTVVEFLKKIPEDLQDEIIKLVKKDFGSSDISEEIIDSLNKKSSQKEMTDLILLMQAYNLVHDELKKRVDGGVLDKPLSRDFKSKVDSKIRTIISNPGKKIGLASALEERIPNVKHRTDYESTGLRELLKEPVNKSGIVHSYSPPNERPKYVGLLNETV